MSLPKGPSGCQEACRNQTREREQIIDMEMSQHSRAPKPLEMWPFNGKPMNFGAASLDRHTDLGKWDKLGHGVLL